MEVVATLTGEQNIKIPMKLEAVQVPLGKKKIM